jgi:hypothetical protein
MASGSNWLHKNFFFFWWAYHHSCMFIICQQQFFKCLHVQVGKSFLKFDQLVNFDQYSIMGDKCFNMGGFVTIECEDLSIYACFIS